MYDFDKITELAIGVESHIRRLEDFTETLKEIKNSLDEMRHSQEQSYSYELNKLRKEVATLAKELVKRGLPEASKYEEEYNEIRDWIMSDSWPPAIASEQVCTEDSHKILRAKSILDGLVGEHLKNKKFLDYGCGEGHVVAEANKREALAFGYDIETEESDTIFCDFEKVAENGPYDIVLMHDVLDHIKEIDPIQALLQAKEVMEPKGKLYIRNHPWSSRHGSHLYTEINKAFMHLVLDEVELTRIGGFTPEYNIRVVTPVETYAHWFDCAKFDVQDEFVIRGGVEDEFKKPSVIVERMSNYWNGDLQKMIDNLEIEFAEYTLVPKQDIDSLI